MRPGKPLGVIAHWREVFSSRVVLTGGAASGKSTVLRVLEDRGLTVASADEVVKSLWALDETRYGVAQALGWDYPFDMDVLKKSAFEDSVVRRALNTYFHGPVMEHLAASGAEVCEIPLAFEAGVSGLFHRVVSVVCDRGDQMERLCGRGLSFEAAESVLASQVGIELRISCSDWILRTSGPLESVFDAAGELASKIIESRNLR